MAARAAWFLVSFLVVCGGLVLFPGIDLWAAGLFYDPVGHFWLADWPPFHILHAASPYLVGAAVLAGCILLLLAARGRRACGRAGMFLLLSLAVGPGLVVNTVFKDHWGRARPAQVAPFGGEKRFTPAFVPSDQCVTNCSFPAGDPAVGFFLVSAGFLLGAPLWRRRAVAGALALGGAIGIARMAQGAHFLSDVIACGFFVFATSWLLHRWIVLNDGVTALMRRPSPRQRTYLLLSLVLVAAIGLSVAWLDRPLAGYVHASPAWLAATFKIVTIFGVSTGYLVIAAALTLGFALGARRAAHGAERRRRALHAWQAGFVFVTVAGAGLAGDILKPLFGRARPKLWLDQGIFGFTWHGARADYWSFPSGHSITIVALALALAQVERRGLPVYVAAALLVAASRIVLDEHYLSDVLAGALVAALAHWAARAGFARALSDSP
jgi:lipid A 4'-phosphatase